MNWSDLAFGYMKTDYNVRCVIAQGGIDNTLRVAQQYCDDALSALQSIRDFDGKEFLVLAVQNLADRKV